MNQDPIDWLRAQDPLDKGVSLAPHLARIETRLAAAVSADQDRAAKRPNPMRWTLALAAPLAVAAVVAVTVLNSLSNPMQGQHASAPVAVISPGSAPSDDLTSCAFNPASHLLDREYVFEGTVLRVSGIDVEFGVTEWIRGPGGSSVTLQLTPGHGGSQLMDEGSPKMVPGDRWRVAGDDGFIWGCGFTIRSEPGAPVVPTTSWFLVLTSNDIATR